MHGDTRSLPRILSTAGGTEPRRRAPGLLTARFFPPSPQAFLPLLPAVLYPVLGGSPVLWLPLVLIALVNCVCLTLLECTALLAVVNLAWVAGRWWLPHAIAGTGGATGLLLSALLLYGRYLVFRRLDVLSGASLRLLELAMVDSLTGAYNRHYLAEEGNRIYHGFRRGGACFSVIVADIDGFKDINDIHGHAGGDLALMWFSGLLNGVLRTQDLAGRYGGDEFLILLPGTRLEEAWRTARRLQEIIAGPREDAPAPCRGLRVSMGLAQVEATDGGFDDVIEHADAALYRAKREGRDTIRAWPSDVREAVVCEA